VSRWGVLVLSGALAAASSVVADPLLAANPDVSTHIAGYSSRAGQNARIVFVSGVVDAIDKDFFGRTKKVAIVSVSDTGALVQNAVEDASVGEELKSHVGDDVTARGVVLVKADGAMSLVVDAFEVHGDRGGFVGGEKRAD
jgi:hypothetical protein